MDIFKVVGLKKPEISIMLDTFLAEVVKTLQINVAVEPLQRLISDKV